MKKQKKIIIILQLKSCFKDLFCMSEIWIWGFPFLPFMDSQKFQFTFSKWFRLHRVILLKVFNIQSKQIYIFQPWRICFRSINYHHNPSVNPIRVLWELFTNSWCAWLAFQKLPTILGHGLCLLQMLSQISTIFFVWC